MQVAGATRAEELRALARRLDWRAALLAVLLGAAYHRAAAVLWHTWQTNDNYSHGPLVPAVSLVLAWRQRARLAALPAREDARGLSLVALAAAMLVLSQRADVFSLAGYSLPLMAAGLVWTLAGPGWLRALVFPLAYLAFMLPFPPALVNDLSFALKQFTVGLSTRVAEALGVELQREGMNIYLANGVLSIENPCSGLRSLLSLLATGALFAYFQPGRAWRKAALFVAAVPLAMLGNAVRISALIVAAHYGSVPQATGRFHDLSGLAVFAVAVLGMFGLRRALEPRVRAGQAEAS
jgi:exosortase